MLTIGMAEKTPMVTTRASHQARSSRAHRALSRAAASPPPGRREPMPAPPPRRAGSSGRSRSASTARPGASCESFDIMSTARLVVRFCWVSATHRSWPTRSGPVGMPTRPEIVGPGRSSLQGASQIPAQPRDSARILTNTQLFENRKAVTSEPLRWRSQIVREGRGRSVLPQRCPRERKVDVPDKSASRPTLVASC